ncbi:BON domain-containing protein [Paraburkholderia unamae]|uniref:BON domain-containing protein n=1 Tax=Paraburkholderia unamae TaxID=219649 RepID=UPI000DC5B02F|nr:BON domain-containing protein [Paraburkholderia unamae]RAR57238.1 BON domain-containing protein [Paraburkholderia unamae]CAG9243472.1 BON domain-containing protein [Paraburkholderia unamae]
MNVSVAGSVVGAMLIAAIAGGASSAIAQTGAQAGAQTGAGMQTVAASSSPPRSRSDSALIRDVRRALGRVPEMDDSGIRITAHQGVVTLTGSVPETWQISRAANAARSVHGVTGVQNRLTEKKKDEAGN